MFTNPMYIAGLMAFGTTIFTGWSYITSFFKRISTYVVVQGRIDGGTLSLALTTYLNKNFKKSPFGVRDFTGGNVYVRPLRKTISVGFETVGKSGGLFWKGYCPIWISTTLQKNSNINVETVSFSFIRGTFNIEELLINSLDLKNKISTLDVFEDNSRFRVNYFYGKVSGRDNDDQNGPSLASSYNNGISYQKPLKWSDEDLGEALSTSKHPTELMILSPEAKEAVKESKFWLESAEWYRDRGIPWKRGWLLYGQPGTGKTSLARSVAQELDIPVYVFDLASLTNEEFRNNWKTMTTQSPAMALLEDIDGTFVGRKNIAVENKQREGLTFDTLLNCIDGVENSEGILTVVTTNCLESIDPAIAEITASGAASRPGRIDRIIEMKEPDEEGYYRVAERILGKGYEHSEFVNIGIGNKETVCQFQERCAREALKSHWSKFKEQVKIVS